MITTNTLELLRVRSQNLRKITQVESCIVNKIQYFKFSVENDSTIYRCDLALLKYRYGIEANEVELLIGEEVVFPNDDENNSVQSWNFDKLEMREVNRSKLYKKIAFEQIGYVFPYAYKKKSATKIALITKLGYAVFLTVKDFERITPLHLSEFNCALGCFIWSPFFEIFDLEPRPDFENSSDFENCEKELENNYKERIEFFSNQGVSNPKDLMFRYYDTYDKLRVDYLLRQDKSITSNRQILKRYKELRNEYLLLRDNRDNFDQAPSNEELNDAFDGFPDAHWNID